MKKVSPSVSVVKPDSASISIADKGFVDDLDTRVSLIQALIPIGLAAVAETLQDEVASLCGERYQRKEKEDPNRRWGSQNGSVFLADQKVPVRVPRVRNVSPGAPDVRAVFIERVPAVRKGVGAKAGPISGAGFVRSGYRCSFYRWQDLCT